MGVPVGLGAALAAGAVLRLAHLGRTGFNSDEAVYAGQAAALAGDPHLSPLFPVVRAHPLLLPGLLSLLYRWGTSDVAGRLLAVAFGLATVVAAYLAATLLHGRRTGVLAAALVAVMPYSVVVSRQVLVDGPLAFFATVTLYLVARYAVTGRAAWLHAAAATAGLAVLSKETGLLLAGSVCAAVATRAVPVRRRDLAVAGLLLAAVAGLYPLALLVSGRAGTGARYLGWQLARPAGGGWGFYAAHVLPAVGWAVLLLAAGGLLARRRDWRDALLVSWVAVPAAAFELWPVKGYPYLLLTAAPLAVLAARALTAVPGHALRPAVAALTLGSLAVPAWAATVPAPPSLAGAGGVPGGRETGRWVAAHVPAGSGVVALGPAMANIVAFYGHRPTGAVAVGAGPANPAYRPVPDLEGRLGDGSLRWLVWDSWTAGTDPASAARVLADVDRLHGRAVHTETVTVDGLPEAAVVVYEVRP